MTDTADQRRRSAPDPLDMALTAAANVDRFAEMQVADPLQAQIQHLGQRGQDTARLAGAMALVSLARDIHQMAGDLHQLALCVRHERHEP